LLKFEEVGGFFSLNFAYSKSIEYEIVFALREKREQVTARGLGREL